MHLYRRCNAPAAAPAELRINLTLWERRRRLISAGGMQQIVVRRPGPPSPPETAQLLIDALANICAARRRLTHIPIVSRRFYSTRRPKVVGIPGDCFFFSFLALEGPRLPPPAVLHFKDTVVFQVYPIKSPLFAFVRLTGRSRSSETSRRCCRGWEPGTT